MADSEAYSAKDGRLGRLRGEKDIEQQTGVGIQDKRSGVPKLRINLPAVEDAGVSKTNRDREPDTKVPYNSSKFDRSSTHSIPNATHEQGHSQRLLHVPDTKWIHSKFDLPHLKPVLRCAFVAWISVLLVVIPDSERVLGQSSFLIMVASFLSPPSEPFVAVLEREITIQLFVVGAFAWSCLGIKIASLSRSQFILDAPLSDIVAGTYIEKGPTLTCAIFLCVGTSILLYLRALMGQGKPIIAAFILSFTALGLSVSGLLENEG